MTDKYEKELRQILKEYEFKMIRISKNGHEIWRLPDGHHFNCNGPNSSLGRRSWRNNIGNLRNLIKKHSIRKPILPLTNKRNEKQMNTTKTIMSIALTKVQIDLKAKDLEKKRKRIQNAIDVDGEGSTAQIHEIENIDKKLIILAQQLTKFTGKTVPSPKIENNTISTQKSKGKDMPKKKRKYETWTESDSFMLKELVSKGGTVKNIARQLKRTESNTKSKMKNLGIGVKTAREKRLKELDDIQPSTLPLPIIVSSPVSQIKNDRDHFFIIRFPSGKEASIPISKSKAEEYALKILADEL
ncbi:hypothetical protein LCGC14_1651690 [marine sediment metagenome]|uniref:Myb-like domain-containing protein n=1 Tax=marine sediment metagenome TaxID=412755 RepID=A0A0F9HWM1_9ZZZZ